MALGYNTPYQIHETVMMNGVRKAAMPLKKMIIAGMVSGFYVIIGAHGMISLLSGAEKSSVINLLSGIIFAVAIMAIAICGGELFTGNCMMVVTALSGRIKFWEVLRNWFIIYFANFAGNIFFAILLFGTGFYGFNYPDDATPHAKSLCALVDKKSSAPAYELFFRGIFANFCVCLAVMFSISANNVEGKILGMVWPVMVFVVSGYEHSIANQGFFALATLVNCPRSHGWYWMNLSVTTPGNICGAAIISMAYYAVYVWETDADINYKKKKDDDATAATTNSSMLSVTCGALEREAKAAEKTACRCPSVVIGTAIGVNDATMLEMRHVPTHVNDATGTHEYIHQQQPRAVAPGATVTMTPAVTPTDAKPRAFDGVTAVAMPPGSAYASGGESGEERANTKAPY